MAQREGAGPSYHSMLTYLGELEAFAGATAAAAREDEGGDDLAALFRRHGAAPEALVNVGGNAEGLAQGVGRLLGAWGGRGGVQAKNEL